MSVETRGVLAILYKLSGGKAGVSVSIFDVAAEMERCGWMKMTPDERDDFHRKIVADVNATRN